MNSCSWSRYPWNASSPGPDPETTVQRWTDSRIQNNDIRSWPCWPHIQTRLPAAVSRTVLENNPCLTMHTDLMLFYEVWHFVWREINKAECSSGVSNSRSRWFDLPQFLQPVFWVYTITSGCCAPGEGGRSSGFRCCKHFQSKNLIANIGILARAVHFRTLLARFLAYVQTENNCRVEQDAKALSISWDLL